MSGKAPRIAKGTRRLLTFRLDTEQRQRLKARLAHDGRTMSEVVTHGLRQYVQHARAKGTGMSPENAGMGESTALGLESTALSLESTARGLGSTGPSPGRSGALVLPDRIAAGLRELRSTGRSELLSATLAALHEAGWPLRPLADALGISRQAVQARVRRAATALRDHVTHCEPPPPFPHRRTASPAGFRPHLTVKIDHALRASAHRAAADEGRSLTQVIEAILDRYLRHGLGDADQPGASRSARRSR